MVHMLNFMLQRRFALVFSQETLCTPAAKSFRRDFFLGCFCNVFKTHLHPIDLVNVTSIWPQTEVT